MLGKIGGFSNANLPTNPQAHHPAHPCPLPVLRPFRGCATRQGRGHGSLAQSEPEYMHGGACDSDRAEDAAGENRNLGFSPIRKARCGDYIKHINTNSQRRKDINLNNVKHNHHEQDYISGYEAVAQEIREIGFSAARDKFNIDNPVGQKPSSLGAYYYAKGGCDALSESIN